MGGHCGIPHNRPVSDGLHLLVPYAFSTAEGCAQALQGLQLPHLQRLAARLGAPQPDPGDEASLSMPHERALARAWGLHVRDGLIPLAAWQAAQVPGTPGGSAWAWITPSHWRVGTDHIRMAHPEELQLDEAASLQLLAAMQPYFAEDGIALDYLAPLQWRGRGELFRELPTASLDRVAGRVIDRWMPSGATGRPLRRLQQEMQMLLYNLPINDERQRQGLLPVNSIWVSGTGALPPDAAVKAPDSLREATGLRAPALAQDWRAWAAAWTRLDATDIAQLLSEHEQGRAVRLTLCGERGTRSWAGAQAPGLWQRLGGLFTKPAPATLLEGL